jgi:diacylglycerol kinase (ATP)
VAVEDRSLDVLAETPLAETVFFVNPRAGSGRAARVWEALRTRHRLAERATVVMADDPASAAAQLDVVLAGAAGSGTARNASRPPRRVIAVGGDGTAFLAANRLVASPRRDALALGFVAGGTGSDLAANLGLPKRPEAALARALAAAPSPIDCLRVTAGGERRVVLNVASAGLSGLVATRVNARATRGPGAYLAATLGALAAYRPFSAAVEVDGEPWFRGAIYLLAVANGRSFGKGMRVAPEALVDDGLADVVVVGDMPRWRVPLELPRLFTGSILRARPVVWRRGRRVRLLPEGPLPPLELDGETLPAGPADNELVPGGLMVLR